MKNVIIKSIIVLALLLLPLIAEAEDDCLSCHKQKTPGIVKIWEDSAHAKAGIGCVNCHGSDHDKIEAGLVFVDMEVCGKCHQQALNEHTTSRHGLGLHSGWGCTRNLKETNPAECRFCHEEGSTKPFSTVQCARFLTQSTEVRELGCNRCHQVENSCASCHSNHLTDLKVVQDPNVCAKCHMGPDHPQWEMWLTSQHGTLYKSAGGTVGPSCQRCHMSKGTHNVSQGLTITPGGVPYPDDDKVKQRTAMITICKDCHSEKFARRELERGDGIFEQSASIVKEAENIIWDLADRRLLQPMPEDRTPHPFSGKVLVTDGQILYEDISHIERLFFKMKKYDFAKTIKGAYHQNPAYTHWYGNAELKMDLVDIKAEAIRLQHLGKMSYKSSQKEEEPEDTLENQLQVLKKKVDRGAISKKQYSEEKKKLLELWQNKGSE